MITIIGKLPRECYVAVSGGVDSMAVLSFLQNRPTKPKVAFFNHGTKTSEEAQPFVEGYCKRHGLEFVVGKIQSSKPKNESPEEHWRNERYGFFHSLNLPVITAHHLGDQVETWIFTALNGMPRLIPYQRENVIRPFLATPKSEFQSWCSCKEVLWLEDRSNQDISFARNRIRHLIVPQAKVINPGIEKVIRKLVLKENKNV